MAKKPAKILPFPAIAIPAPKLNASSIPQLRPRLLAAKLRNVAEQWRHTSHPLEVYKLQTHAGELVIEAARKGALHFDGLDELVAWHTSREPLPPGTARLLRCPFNLFMEIKGGHLASVVRNGKELQLEMHADGTPKTHGGLLELDGPAACEFLARMIEDETRLPPKAGRPPMSPDQQAVFELLEKLEPGRAMMGTQIVSELSRKGIGIEQSTLTSRIIPFLKKHYSVKNQPGAGYYVDKS